MGECFSREIHTRLVVVSWQLAFSFSVRRWTCLSTCVHLCPPEEGQRVPEDLALKGGELRRVSRVRWVSPPSQPQQTRPATSTLSGRGMGPSRNAVTEGLCLTGVEMSLLLNCRDHWPGYGATISEKTEVAGERADMQALVGGVARPRTRCMALRCFDTHVSAVRSAGQTGWPG
jgi:hypothetical protein